MSSELVCDEQLLQRLPLPLAQLYRRGHNAKSALERHQAAYYLWEAGLKLLGSVAIVEFAERDCHDPELIERLQNLARPAIGHWWEFVRRLVPVLAEAGDESFAAVRELLLGRTRDDLPRAAGLDAALCEALGAGSGSQATVRLSELFEHLLRYRNRILGHGAAGQHGDEFYEQIGRALLAGVPEVFARLDVLAGRKLVYVAEVRRQATGAWLVEQYELIGESARRIPSLELPAEAAAELPRPERLYLREPAGWSPGFSRLGGRAPPDGGTPTRNGTESVPYKQLHPLALYDPESREALLLNSRRGADRTEYLSYSTGRVQECKDFGDEQRQLLAKLLGTTVDEGRLAELQAHAQAEEQAAAPAVAEHESDPALRRLGEFELLSELGRGGMGVVYRAWQPSLGRQVALKSMLRSGDPKAEARFAREIRVLGRVEHPHLVKVFTSGAAGDRWFYSMELIEGATLAAVCDRVTARSASAADVDLNTWHHALSTVCEDGRKAEKPFSEGKSRDSTSSAATQPRAPSGSGPSPAVAAGRSYVRHVVALVRQAAEAAHELHRAGVVHRDIKPGNIMLTADGAKAVLMDLGLAQLIDETEGRLTRTRQFVGTLRYASPEQVMAAGKIDGRSDVYSLGATLWELLTLRPMFAASEETPTLDLMTRIQFKDPERIRKHNPAAPPDLDAIVSKCLEKNPEHRYASAAELSHDLGRFLTGEPVEARPVGELERAWRWCRRNPHISGLLAAVLLVLACGLAGVSWKWREAVVNLNRAQTAEQQAHDEADKARASQTLADQRRRQAEESRYAADMRLALQAAEEGDLGRAQNLVHRYQGPRSANDLRGFEWRLLWRLFQGDSLATLHAHTDRVDCVAFSPDGTRLATGGNDALVNLIDVPAQKVLRSVKLNGRGVNWVEFSPDGKTLAVATGNWEHWQEDGRVFLYDANTLALQAELPGHTEACNLATFSADGKLLATGAEDNRVLIWKLPHAPADKPTVLIGRQVGVNGLAFSRDGSLLAAGSGDGHLQVWRLPTMEMIVDQVVHDSGVISVTFVADRPTLVIGTRDGSILEFDPLARRTLATFDTHQGTVQSVVCSRDGKLIVTAGSNCTIKVWDAASNAELTSFRGHTDIVYAVAVSRSADLIASASRDTTVKLWRLNASRALGEAAEISSAQSAVPTLHQDASAPCVAFSHDGRTLLTACGVSSQVDPPPRNTVMCWNSLTGDAAGALGQRTDVVYAVAFSPDDTLIATGCQDATVTLWDAKTRQKIRQLQGHADAVMSVAFSPDGKTLATASRDTTVKLWPISTAAVAEDSSSSAAAGSTATAEPVTLAGHEGWVKAVTFSPDGRLLASCSIDRTARLWDPITKRLVATLPSSGPCMSVAFSPRGNRLAVGSKDRTVRVWDVAAARSSSGRAGSPSYLADEHDAIVLQGNRSAILSVAFNADGTTLAAGCQDATVTLWNLPTQQEVAVLHAHNGGVLSLAFSPDGNLLATGSSDQTTKLWRALDWEEINRPAPEQGSWTHP